ncbi:MAG: CopG family transcriptional regulator [archaeon]
MPSDVVTVRFDDKTKKQISKFLRQRLESQSEVIRKAVAQYVQKENELGEIKQVVAQKFAEGKISFDELVRIIGYEEAKKVAYLVDVTEKSLKEGI